VAFLDMYAAMKTEPAALRVAALPSLLLKNTTEYAYLFRQVMDGVANGTTTTVCSFYQTRLAAFWRCSQAIRHPSRQL